MKGYAVLIEEPGREFPEEDSAKRDERRKCRQKANELLFVEASDARERYAVPSAFSAYWNAIIESSNMIS